MPKVGWCKTEAQKRAEIGEEFFRRLEAAREYEHMSIYDMLCRVGMTKGTYYRRKDDPEGMTVQEARKLAEAVRLCSTAEGRKAYLMLVGAE